MVDDVSGGGGSFEKAFMHVMVALFFASIGDGEFGGVQFFF